MCTSLIKDKIKEKGVFLLLFSQYTGIQWEQNKLCKFDFTKSSNTYHQLIRAHNYRTHCA